MFFRDMRLKEEMNLSELDVITCACLTVQLLPKARALVETSQAIEMDCFLAQLCTAELVHDKSTLCEKQRSSSA